LTVIQQCVYEIKFRNVNQEATGRPTAWIGLEQNVTDTAVNEWRKRLLACVRIVGQQSTLQAIFLQAVEKWTTG